MAAAHGFLQGAPPFGRFQEWVGEYLCNDKEVHLIKVMLCRSMIPTNMSSASVDKFIDKSSKTNSQTNLDTILDDARMQAVVDNTQWGFHQVTRVSREALIREVVFTEVG